MSDESYDDDYICTNLMIGFTVKRLTANIYVSMYRKTVHRYIILYAIFVKFTAVVSVDNIIYCLEIDEDSPWKKQYITLLPVSSAYWIYRKRLN